MASANPNPNETLISSEPLLEFCLRSLGEMQLVNRAGWAYICKVNENAQLYDSSKEEMRLAYEIQVLGLPGMSQSHPPPHTIPAVVGKMKCLEFNTALFIDVQENHKPVKQTWKFVPLNEFIEQFAGKNQKRKADYMKLSIQRREEFFWTNHLYRFACKVVPSIQRAIAQLVKKGVEYWTLPDGTQVSWDKIRVKTIEVAPKFLAIMKRRIFGNTIGFMGFGIINPNWGWREIKSVLAEATVRRLDSELGVVVTHYVLEVNTGSEDMLIIDPTGIQYGFKGPNSTIFWYGTWGDYIKEFPGKVLGEVTKSRNPYQFPTLELETFFLGEGPMKYITRLTQALVKNIGKKMCARCGLREGPKLLFQNNIEGNDSPLGEAWEDIPERKKISCSSCSNVSYCNDICKELDSKNHLCV